MVGAWTVDDAQINGLAYWEKHVMRWIEAYKNRSKLDRSFFWADFWSLIAIVSGCVCLALNIAAVALK